MIGLKGLRAFLSVAVERGSERESWTPFTMLATCKASEADNAPRECDFRDGNTGSKQLCILGESERSSGPDTGDGVWPNSFVSFRDLRTSSARSRGLSKFVVGGTPSEPLSGLEVEVNRL